MRLKTFFQVVTLMMGFMTCSIYAGTVKMPVCNYGAVTIDSIKCVGHAILNGTRVKGSLIVTGSLDANHVLIQDLKVTGPVNLSNTTIQGRSSIVGHLSSDATAFNHEVTVKGASDFNKSELKSRAEFTGLLTTKSSSFLSDVHVTSNRVDIDGGRIQGKLIIKSTNKTPFLYIYNHPVLGQGVYFVHMSGVVISSTNHSEGKYYKIINGTYQSNTQ